jgi:hypothetical protein
MIRYSIAAVLLTTAAVAIGMAILIYSRGIFAAYFAAVLLVGCTSVVLSMRARLWLTMLCAACATSPLFAGSIYIPGFGLLHFPLDAELLQIVAYRLYSCACEPLQYIGSFGPAECHELIYTSDGKYIREYAVLECWLGIAAALASSIVVTKVRSSLRAKRFQPKATTA